MKKQKKKTKFRPERKSVKKGNHYMAKSLWTCDEIQSLTGLLTRQSGCVLIGQRLFRGGVQHQVRLERNNQTSVQLREFKVRRMMTTQQVKQMFDGAEVLNPMFQG